MRYGNPNHEKIALHWFEEHETLLQKEDNTEDDAEYLQERKSFCCSHYNLSLIFQGPRKFQFSLSDFLVHFNEIVWFYSQY